MRAKRAEVLLRAYSNHTATDSTRISRIERIFPMHNSIGVSPADLKVKKQDDDLFWCDAKSRRTGRIRFIREIRVEAFGLPS